MASDRKSILTSAWLARVRPDLELEDVLDGTLRLMSACRQVRHFGDERSHEAFDRAVERAGVLGVVDGDRIELSHLGDRFEVPKR